MKLIVSFKSSPETFRSKDGSMTVLRMLNAGTESPAAGGFFDAASLCRLKTQEAGSPLLLMTARPDRVRRSRTFITSPTVS